MGLFRSLWRPDYASLKRQLEALERWLDGRVEPWHIDDAVHIEDWAEALVEGTNRASKVSVFELYALRRDAREMRRRLSAKYMMQEDEPDGGPRRA